MDEIFEQFSDDLKELVNILASGKAVEFEHDMRKGAKEEIMDTDEVPLSAKDKEHYKEFLAALLAAPDDFLSHLYAGGFRDGFCACLRCLKMCEERNLDSIDDLLKSLRQELSEKSPFERMMAKINYMKDRF